MHRCTREEAIESGVENLLKSAHWDKIRPSDIEVAVELWQITRESKTIILIQLEAVFKAPSMPRLPSFDIFRLCWQDFIASDVDADWRLKDLNFKKHTYRLQIIGRSVIWSPGRAGVRGMKRRYVFAFARLLFSHVCIGPDFCKACTRAGVYAAEPTSLRPTL
jgi:hypothetical protein